MKAVLFSDAWSGSVGFKSIVPGSMDTECLDVVLIVDLPTKRVYQWVHCPSGSPLANRSCGIVGVLMDKRVTLSPSLNFEREGFWGSLKLGCFSRRFRDAVSGVGL